MSGDGSSRAELGECGRGGLEYCLRLCVNVRNACERCKTHVSQLITRAYPPVLAI